MKKIDLNTFIFRLTDEIRHFEETQMSLNPEDVKTQEQWVNHFLVFSGYEDEEGDYETSEYEDDLYYGDSFEYQELVNRRKYRSFRDDDRY